MFPVLTQTEKALLRAQSGLAAGVAFSDVPCSFFTRIEPHLFWTLPLSPCPRLCRCVRPLHSHGHHRAACSRAGVGRDGIAVKSAAARICREAGARVTTNVLMRGLDVGVPVADTRRLEVVADGLPLFGGMQLTVDTTLGSTLHGSERRSWRRRHCPGPCQVSQSENVPRVLWSPQSSPVGGVGGRGGRQVVHGNSDLLVPVPAGEDKKSQ